MASTMKIQQRSQRLVNTDPQRRCYNGCHFSYEMVWNPWEDLESFLEDDRIEERLEFWKNLNNYAMKERGKDAQKEFRIVPKELLI